MNKGKPVAQTSDGTSSTIVFQSSVDHMNLKPIDSNPTITLGASDDKIDTPQNQAIDDKLYGGGSHSSG